MATLFAPADFAASRFSDAALHGGRAMASSAPRAAGKISPELLTLYDAYREARVTGRALRFEHPLVRIVADRVLIDAAAAGDARALEAELVDLGMRGAAAFGRLVSGELPIDAIPALGSVANLAFARASAVGTVPGTGLTPRGP